MLILAIHTCTRRRLLQHGSMYMMSLTSLQVEKEKRRLAAMAAAEAKAKQAQSWLGWLTGSKPPSPSAADAEERGDLNDEEAAKLQELVDEREEAIKAGAVALCSA